MTQTTYSLRRSIELRENFRSEGYKPFERYFDAGGNLHIKLSHHNGTIIEIEVNEGGAAIYRNRILKKFEIFPNHNI